MKPIVASGRPENPSTDRSSFPDERSDFYQISSADLVCDNASQGSLSVGPDAQGIQAGGKIYERVGIERNQSDEKIRPWRVEECSRGGWKMEKSIPTA
jgi:hypothetical protein